MDLVFVIIVEMLYAVASLVLISAGLAIVFGMMKIINLAHGEFMMMGGYVTITAVTLGANVFVAMLIIAPVVVGLIGLVVERLVIRHLYGRLVDTMLATWGLSLFFIGLATMIFGNTTTGISTPISGFTVGNYQVNGYNFFIILIAIVLLGLMYAVLKGTRLGLIARGAMQLPDMAAALGYSPERIYMATFFCGSALSGLAGAILAPSGRPGADTARSLHRQGLHHGDCRRSFADHRIDGQFRSLRLHQPDLHVCGLAGDGRSGAAGGRGGAA